MKSQYYTNAVYFTFLLVKTLLLVRGLRLRGTERNCDCSDEGYRNATMYGTHVIYVVQYIERDYRTTHYHMM